MNKEIIHLDCTLRDGGYYTNWNFKIDTIESYLAATDSAGIDVVEIGYRFIKNNGFKGACGYSKDNFLTSLRIPENLTLAVMINVVDIESKGILNIKILEELVPNKAKDSPVNLFRLATYKDTFGIAIKAASWLKEKGYRVGINIMHIYSLNESEIKKLALQANKSSFDVLYFADSLGNLTCIDVERIIKNIKENWSGEIGFHAHDSTRAALVNTLKSIECGVKWIDSTITGMGRGAGNLRTEEFIYESTRFKNKACDIIPLLKLVDEVFEPLKIIHKWGTNIFYYLAGKYNIHPTYIQEMLKGNQYKIEEILFVIEELKKLSAKSFNKELFSTAKDFYSDNPKGDFDPKELFSKKKLLLLGGGNSIFEHKNIIENYIVREKPIVVALNANNQIDPKLISYRIASHPLRILADSNKYKDLNTPIITPKDLSKDKDNKDIWEGKKILKYGLKIQEDKFLIKENYCIVPYSNVLAYALSIIFIGNTENLYLAGFDGYSSYDLYERNEEMNSIFAYFLNLDKKIKINSITPTIYKIPQISVYGI